MILDSGNSESGMALTDGLEGGFWCDRRVERVFSTPSSRSRAFLGLLRGRAFDQAFVAGLCSRYLRVLCFLPPDWLDLLRGQGLRGALQLAFCWL